MGCLLKSKFPYLTTMINSWVDFAKNPEAVSNLFDNPPSLENIEIVSMFLSREGACCHLNILIPCTPDRIPKRWIGQQIQKVSIRLEFIDLKEFNASGWSSNPVGNLDIFTKDRHVFVKFVGNSESLGLESSFVRVGGIEPVG